MKKMHRKRLGEQKYYLVGTYIQIYLCTKRHKNVLKGTHQSHFYVMNILPPKNLIKNVTLKTINNN